MSRTRTRKTDPLDDRLVSAEVIPVRLPLRQSVTTSTRAPTRESLMIRVESRRGLVGWGESCPLDGFDAWTLADCARELRGLLIPPLIGRPLKSLYQRLVAVYRRDTMGGGPRAICPHALAGLDTAVADLCSRAVEGTLAIAFDEETIPAVPVCARISASSPIFAEEQAYALESQGFECAKVSVGRRGLDEEDALIAAVRRGGPDLTIRLDAGGAWTVDEAIIALRRLSAHDLEYVERPIAAGDIRGLRRVRLESGARVAFSSPVIDASSMAELLSENRADALCARIGASGLLGAAFALARSAQKLGLEVYVNSMSETAVGRTASLHLAAALGGAVAPCDIAGDPLAVDVAPFPLPEDGVLWVPEDLGLGTRVDEEAVQRYRFEL